MAPGFGLPPDALRPLAEAVMAQAPGVRLWVALAAIDYPGLARDLGRPGMSHEELGAAIVESGRMGAAVDGAVSAAAAAGFKARATSWGRVTNLYVLAHSAAGLLLNDVMFKSAAGAVMLASVFNAGYTRHETVNLEDWGRPLLMLVGELDGQMRWPWLAPHIYSSACLAAKAGPGFAAAHRPAILIPGVNHAHTTAPPPPPPAPAAGAGAPAPPPQPPPPGARGDVPSEVPAAAASEALAAAIAAFLACHAGGGGAGGAAGAGRLLELSSGTAAMAAPWFEASGMGDIEAAWRPTAAGASGTTDGGAAAAPEGGAANASGPGGDAGARTNAGGGGGGAQLQGAFRSARGRASAALHPGVVSEAERFAADAQAQLLAPLPEEAAARVRVVASVHTDLEALIYNQPLLEPQPDGTLVLLVHSYLHWRADDFPQGGPDAHRAALQASQHRRLNTAARRRRRLVAARGAAPEYWLKLKRPQAVAEALGLEGSFQDGLTPRDLQSSTLAAALAAAPPRAAARRAARGAPLEVAEAALWPGMDAEAFFKESALAFESMALAAPPTDGEAAGEAAGGPEPAPGAVRLVTPLMVTPSPGELARGGGGGGGDGANGGGGGGDGANGGAGGAAARAAAVDAAYSSRFLGNWYTKALSRALALEWKLLDSLRPASGGGGGTGW
ncbi:MAG: hypothetical protein J3K34DRAFT_513136 [Monoraphidium minutum]|nr:MAG: hypothetical protein J3K34DRAFT_513136 [Monoraphidium minutum]